MAETLGTSSRMEPEIAYSVPPVISLHNGGRVEIDTSAPFESVREAANRFGGIGFWKPYQHKLSETAEPDEEETDIAKLHEQAVELEKGLIMKERETLEVLKELEATKTTVEELKSKLLQKEVYQVINSVERCANLDPKSVEKGNFEAGHPVFILMELNQAKLNLSRTTHDLSDICSYVKLLQQKLEKERTPLEKTRERLTLNRSKVVSLEKELTETETKLKFAKDPEIFSVCSDKPSEILKELQRLSSEAENSKKMGENARLLVVRAMSEIEQMKSRIKTAEIRLVAARKMKEAARAAEAVALAEIKATSNIKNLPQNGEAVTISLEKYSLLTQKAKDAEEKAEKRVEDAMLKVDGANVSEAEIQKKAEGAAEKIKTSKKALEEAVERAEAANNAKLEAEEALRKWRSDNGQKRRSSSVHNTTKFKNPCPSQHMRESHLLDVNGLNLINGGTSSMPVLKSTLSIGQILSRKLVLTDQSEVEMLAEEGSARQKVSLGQMLSKKNGDVCLNKKDGKENGKPLLTGKRKKFRFGKLLVLLNKDIKKKRKTNLNLR